MDLISLKELCRTPKGHLKTLWRRTRYSLLQMLKQRESECFNGPLLCTQPDQIANSDVRTSEKTVVLPHTGTLVQDPAKNSGDMTSFECDNGSMAAEVEIAVDEKITASSEGILTSPREEVKEKYVLTFTDVGWAEQEMLSGHGFWTPSKNKKALRKMRPKLSVNNIPSSKTTISSALTLNTQGTDSFLDRIDSRLKESLETSSISKTMKVMPSSAAEKFSISNSQLRELSAVDDAECNVEQAENLTDGFSISEQGTRSNNYSGHVQGKGSKCDRAAMSVSLGTNRVNLRQARLAAKQFLLDTGWKLEVRNRGPSAKEEVVYVSPSGSRYFSLIAACRGWKSQDNHDDNTFIEKGVEILKSYSMAEDLRCVRKLHSTQERAKQRFVSHDPQKGEAHQVDFKISDSLICAFDKTRVAQKSLECPSFSDMQANSSSQEDAMTKKKAISQIVGNQKKRKSEVLEGLPLTEVKRKRSRSSSKRGGCRMQVLLSFPGGNKELVLSKSAGELPQFKKSTVLSWLMDKGVLKENERVAYINKKDGHVMKYGHVTREGVVCNCCNEVFTLSNFEAHAGSKLHRPSANIFLDDGRSISDCQLEACALQDAKEKEGPMEINDDTCGVCGDGGEIVLCDHCPSTFHANCIGLEIIPEGDWYCPRCCCGICGSNQLSAHDIDSSMHRCEQCELEYHLICAQGHDSIPTPRMETSPWFCDSTCKEIFIALRALVGLSNPLEGGYCWTLLRSMKKDRGLLATSLEEMAEYHSKLSVAHGVMQECFVPMIDPRTNINLLSQAIYNRRSKVTRLNYTGFYTMVLEKGDEIISVATIRIHGARLAEMPLVGTRYQYRRQGMCRRLVQALEEMLRSIGVEKLILPAVPELLDTWMGAFNFIKITPEETRELSKLSLMTFPGTVLLQKYLPSNVLAKKFSPSQSTDQLHSSESLSCKPVEGILSMACPSLDNGVLNRRRAFIDAALSGIGQSPSKFNVYYKIPRSYRQYSSVAPRTPVTFEASKGSSYAFANGGKYKNRFKIRKHFESSGDCLMTSKAQNEEDIYTSVVITTTRSNRLVKSRRWVADGLKELRIAKQSKRTPVIPEFSSEPEGDFDSSQLFETLTHSNIGQECPNAQRVYVRTRRRTPISVESAEVYALEGTGRRDWFCNSTADSVLSDCQHGYNSLGFLFDQQEGNTNFIEDHENFSSNHRVDRFCPERESLDFEIKYVSPVCAKVYSRRNRKDTIHTSTSGGFSESSAADQNNIIEEKGMAASFEGTLWGLKSCSIVSEIPCESHEGERKIAIC
ncbi:hypothetical protein KP509_04G075300 [Ceratopteris richardii]|nr:hypothetical protein KP509_04G075300 [Ceratopteris richardii]